MNLNTLARVQSFNNVTIIILLWIRINGYYPKFSSDGQHIYNVNIF